MGIFSFFSRKPPNLRSSSRSVKGHAYEATVASEPPLRGAYPVAGNGPNVFDTLAKSSNFKNTQFPLDVDIDSCAPSPSVPRYQEDDILRPKTAPNGYHSGGMGNDVHRRQSSFRGRTLSFRKSRVSFSRPASAFGETPEFAHYGQGFTQVFPPASPSATGAPSLPPTPATPRHRHRSLLSDGGRSVDVLDAQLELSPRCPDFKSRTEAAGVRDYGEDVADRNIALCLHSANVQAFYSPAVAGKSRPPNRDLPLTAVPNEATNALKYRDNYVPGQSQKTVKQANPTKASRSGSLKRQGSLSKGTYVPKGTNSGIAGNTSTSVRPLSLHQDSHSGDTRSLSSCISTMLPERPKTSWEPDRDQHVPPVPHYTPLRQQEGGEPVEGNRSRLPVAVPFSYASHPAGKFHSRFQSCKPRSATVSMADSSSRGSVPRTSASVPVAAPSPSASRRHTSLFLELPVSFAVNDGSDSFESLKDAESEPFPYLDISRTRNDNERTIEGPDVINDGVIVRRATSVFDKTEPWSVWDPASGRTSSSWRLSTSSGYTPDTSIDYGLSMPLSATLSDFSLQLDPMGPGSSAFSLCKPLRIVHGSRSEAMTRRDADDDFNMDDYISSDDDFFGRSISPDGRYEENLLFREGGYGASGMELPGIGLAFDGAAEEWACMAPAPLFSLAPIVPRRPPIEQKWPINHSMSLSHRNSQPVPPTPTPQEGKYRQRRRRRTRQKPPLRNGKRESQHRLSVRVSESDDGSGGSSSSDDHFFASPTVRNRGAHVKRTVSSSETRSSSHEALTGLGDVFFP